MTHAGALSPEFTRITVLTFPRGLKSPTTSRYRGFSFLLRSLKTLFVTSSCEMAVSLNELR